MVVQRSLGTFGVEPKCDDHQVGVVCQNLAGDVGASVNNGIFGHVEISFVSVILKTIYKAVAAATPLGLFTAFVNWYDSIPV